ncbi:ABC transporter permease, partial [Corynebacterium nasicanis]
MSINPPPGRRASARRPFGRSRATSEQLQQCRPPLPRLRRTRLSRAHPALLTLAVVTVAVVATPLLFLLTEVFAADPQRITGALQRPRTLQLMINTLLLTAGATVGTVLIGVPTAFLLVRTNLVGRRWWWIAAALPLAIPSYVAGLAWVSGTPLRGYIGSVLVLVLVSTPYVTLPVAAALRRADTSIEEVARTLGRSPLRAFLTMTLPQVAPAAGAGALLVALYSISEFGVVAIMRYPALTPAVQTAFSGTFNRELAMVLSLLLVVLALLVVAAERALRRPVTALRVRGDDAAPL